MASEIRTNSITSRTGLSTISLTSTGPIFAGIATFTGSIGVAGTLTYEDVTNIDSVGVITARDGLRVTGISTLSGDVFVGSGITCHASAGIVSANVISSGPISLFKVDTGGRVKTTNGFLTLQSVLGTVIEDVDGNNQIKANNDSSVQLYFNANEKLVTTNKGVVVTGVCTATAFVSDTPLSHRNIIVNGGCLVAQRGTSSASANFASVDRMKMSVTNIDQLAFLQKQTNDGPDGFSKCFEFDVTTVENALDADDLVYMRYAVEAQDLIPFFNANGSGKNFTLSFYVKSYQTGTYQVAIYKADATARFITRTYTIASSGVWQRVILNFTGDTGTSGINADNGLGFQISFMLAAGTNYTSGSEQPTWGGWPGNPGFAAGQAVNTLSSTDNYWRITGIQLELGDVATPFEHRTFGEELTRCKRYYQTVPNNLFIIRGSDSISYSNAPIQSSFILPESMRASPDGSNYTDGGSLITVTYYNASYGSATNYEANISNDIHNGTVRFHLSHNQANNSGTTLSTSYKWGQSVDPIAFSAEI